MSRCTNHLIRLITFFISMLPVLCERKDILLLSPFIEKNETDIGRNLSVVDSSHMLGIKSYSGFITVNKKFNSNMFFWYFPVEGGDVENCPFIIWFQGGPGVSTLMSLFSGVGPFFHTENVLKENPYSWHKNHSILFIDNPIGAGFSFCDSNGGYSSNQNEISTNVYSFLMQFFKLFPELVPLPLYLCGQSYAGKHIPDLAHFIHTKNPTAQTFINLKGMIIGNGWIDPPNMYKYSGFLHQLGLVDYNFKKSLEKSEKRLEESLQRGNNLTEANILNLKIIERIITATKVSMYNYFYETDETCFTFGFKNFIERQEIREALHVGNSSHLWNNDVTRLYLLGDEMISVVPFLEELVEHYGVLVYNGQLDLIVPYPMLEKVYINMNWSGAEEFRKAERKPWFDSENFYGYKKKVRNFEEVMVRNVGHCVAAEKPKLLRELVTEFIANEQRNKGIDLITRTSPTLNEIQKEPQ